MMERGIRIYSFYSLETWEMIESKFLWFCGWGFYDGMGKE
jgi:hypothetical protein